LSRQFKLYHPFGVIVSGYNLNYNTVTPSGLKCRKISHYKNKLTFTSYLYRIFTMPSKSKQIRYIFILYWFLLAYILAALIWWFIALNRQNILMTKYELEQLQPTDKNYQATYEEIRSLEKRKTTQYLGEGVTFFLLIIAGAVFVFRAVRRELRISQQQQNFMIAITHELKTPISVARLNLETMQKRKLDETQQKRLIQTTLEETNRLNALCNNMLLSSQIEAGGYRITNEETNFSELVSKCVQDFITRYPQQKIEADIASDIFINGDRLLLQMLVNNLIDNAIKYSAKELPVTVSLKEENEKIILKVKDRGKGIAAAEKDKIFNKFYRVGNSATKAAKGTGLGLYLVKKISTQHNANISVTDNDPSGAIFTVTLHSSIEKQ
jgi:two-component system sensor histidine kinase CiaH